MGKNIPHLPIGVVGRVKALENLSQDLFLCPFFTDIFLVLCNIICTESRGRKEEEGEGEREEREGGEGKREGGRGEKGREGKREGGGVRR